MDTKLKGDIGEYAAILKALKNEWGVSKPIGDRLPYDLIIDVEGRLIKIQVKVAWLDKNNIPHVDTRRTKTNRRRMIRARYSNTDFDFAVIQVDQSEDFFILPSAIFNGYKSNISFSKNSKLEEYRNSWNLISQKTL